MTTNKEHIVGFELQKRVALFVEKNDLETNSAHRLLDLISEVGEMAKELLKATKYGKASFQRTDNWAMEMGDTFFSLICLANSTGVDLDKSLMAVLAKYVKRIEVHKDAGSGG